ncbi:MAG: methionyl-tRNA formyltransferase [Kiritimatiellae bacterium]|nr:methionyl-tRNA formyltransferase [Kiritimatiellia bacterium]
MRIVFMGSSEASAQCLKGILRHPMLKVVGVVTQPDRPVGRGRTITPCACRRAARDYKIADEICITPPNVNEPDVVAKIRAWKPDCIVVVAFGQFLGKELLEMPRFGCINCHFSLLPKYRGASPVTEAILNGDEYTGVSVIKMEEGMDDGAVYWKTPIGMAEQIYPYDTSVSLMDRLAFAGGAALGCVLANIDIGRQPPPVPQDGTRATFAHKHKKTDGLIDWNKPSVAIERQVRAFTPWPGSYTFLPPHLRKKGSTGRLIVGLMDVVREIDEAWRTELPGTILALTQRGPVVRTADGAVRLLAVQLEGTAMMNAGDFTRSRTIEPFKDMLSNG